MKNTESIGWLYDWFTFSSDYVRGMKQKLRTSRNKISMQILVTGARCTIVWAIRDGNAPYWRTHHLLMGHIKFWRDGAAQSVVQVLLCIYRNISCL
jgi:hypothetical protein